MQVCCLFYNKNKSINSVGFFMVLKYTIFEKNLNSNKLILPYTYCVYLFIFSNKVLLLKFLLKLFGFFFKLRFVFLIIMF